MSDDLEIFQEHRSLFNYSVLHRTRTVETNRPGTHRRVAIRPRFLRCFFGLYVFLPFNKFSLAPNVPNSILSGDGGI